MAEPFEGELKLRGVEEIKRDLAGLEKRIERTMKGGGKATKAQSTELKNLKKELDKSTKASAEMSGKTVKLAQDASSLGGAFASLSPSVASLGTSFSAAGQAAGVLGTSFGPVGVGIGVLAAALPGLINFVSELGDESNDTAIQLKSLGDSIDDTIGKLKKLDRERSLKQRKEQGLLTAEEARAFAEGQAKAIRNRAVDSLRKRLEELGIDEQIGRAIGGAGDAAATARRLAAEAAPTAIKEQNEIAASLEVTLKKVSKAQEELTEARREAIRVREVTNQLDREEVEVKAESEKQDKARAKRDKAASAAARQREADRRADAEALARQLGFFKREQEQLAKQAQAFREHEEWKTKVRKEEEEKRFRLAREFGAEEARVRQKYIEGIGEISEQATSFAVDTFTLVAQGEKSLGAALKETTKSFLAEFAVKNAFQGAEALAIAIGNTPFNPILASAKFQQAGQHFAIAAAAGGGAAAIPGGGGGGGGGGAAEPTPAGGGGDSEGGGTVIVNINSPVPEAQIGRMNRRAEREATRRFSSRS